MKVIEILNIDSKLICDYDCGKIAKYRFNNGKVCCENHYNKCESIKTKNRTTQLNRKRPEDVILKIKNSVVERMKRETTEEKKKYASKKRTIESILKLCPNFLDYEEIEQNINTKEFLVHCKNPNCENSKEKDGWFIPNSRNIEYRCLCINKNKINSGWFYCNKNCRNTDKKYKEYISKNRLDYYNNLEKEEHNKKYLYPRKITIEQIQQRYPIFYQNEEIRYKPNEEYKRIIQGRCKNPNCENSKEKNGWFDLDRRQLESRIVALENPKMSANLFFFCSYDCKITSGLYSRKPGSLQNNNDFIEYSKEVWRYTYYSVKENKNKIKNIELRSTKYHLDHKYSITQGFIDNVDPKILAHWKNLEILTQFDNISKHSNCSIELDKLLEEIKNSK